ncbi:IS30 family transposase, partial [Peptoniphilus sp. MSJ-1]
KTIYNWLYSGIINFNITKLRRKAKSRKVKETRGRFNIGTPIRKRPKLIKKREEFGHWELDTVVSSRGKSKGCLATFVEMKSRFYIAIPMKDRSKDSMLEAIKKLIYPLPKQALKSFTSDRGKEFACYKDIENMGIEFYFADPYSAWQRGTNENSNGLLREYYPKKTDLAKISVNELIKNLMELNSRPRKCLNYQTPFDVFMHELSLL